MRLTLKVKTVQPAPRSKGEGLPWVPRREHGEGKRMKRILLCIMVLSLALAAALNSSAAPQTRSDATLSGVVIGPDDRPVAHASVSYQSANGSAPHVVHTDSHGHFTIPKLKA